MNIAAFRMEVCCGVVAHRDQELIKLKRVPGGRHKEFYTVRTPFGAGRMAFHHLIDIRFLTLDAKINTICARQNTECSLRRRGSATTGLQILEAGVGFSRFPNRLIQPSVKVNTVLVIQFCFHFISFPTLQKDSVATVANK